jgi:3-hydroxybutyryl-CoA dehydratase
MISRPFSEVSAGERFGDRLTMSSWHVATAAAMYYDPGPNHVNLEHSETNRFGRPIAPGFLTTGLMMGVVGRYFGWSIEAFLEAHTRFLSPVYVDDTIEVLWVVQDTEKKASLGGGILGMHGWCWARPDRLAVELKIKLAVNESKPPPLRDPPNGTSPASRRQTTGAEQPVIEQ